MKNKTIRLAETFTKQFLLLFFAVAFNMESLFSQNVGINSGGSTPDAAAGLDVSFSDKGMLIPRLTTAQRDAINGGTFANSLFIFNTDDNCFQAYNMGATVWENVYCFLSCSSAPNTPGSITGNTEPCQNETGLTYSIAQVPGATSYNWTVPSGATITAGQGTTGIIINMGTSSGNVSVTASNSCGISSARTLALTLGSNSTAPTGASASVNPTCGGSTDLSVTGGSLGSGATWEWYSGSCGGTSVGSGTPLTVTPASTTTYYVRAEGTCNTTTCASVAVTVNPGGPTADVYGTWRAGAADPTNLGNAVDGNDATVTGYGIGGFPSWPCGGCSHSTGLFRYDFGCSQPSGTKVRAKTGHYRSMNFSGNWNTRVLMMSSVDGTTWTQEQVLVDDTHSTEHVTDITVTVSNAFRYIGIMPSTLYTENASSVRVYEVEIVP